MNAKNARVYSNGSCSDASFENYKGPSLREPLLLESLTSWGHYNKQGNLKNTLWQYVVI